MNLYQDSGKLLYPDPDPGLGFSVRNSWRENLEWKKRYVFHEPQTVVQAPEEATTAAEAQRYY